jgi:hypothetical protein
MKEFTRARMFTALFLETIVATDDNNSHAKSQRIGSSIG